MSKPAAEKKENKKGQKDKEAVKWDWSRETGPDPRDPRVSGPPCRGNHIPQPMGRGSKSGANGHGRWITCSRCSLHLSYVPAIGSTATYRSAGPLPADVTEVIKEKGDQVLPEELDTKRVGLQAAETALLRRLEVIQDQKKKFDGNTPNEDEKMDQMTQDALAKKQAKRGNEKTPEELEQSGQSEASTPWSNVTAGS